VSALCEIDVCTRWGYHASTCAGNCRGCSPREVAPGMRICWPHRDQIEQDAKASAEVYHELTIAMMGGSGGLTERVSGSSSPRLPFSPKASELRTEISHVLTAWCSYLVEQRSINPPPDSIDARASFVARHASWLAASEVAASAWSEMHWLAHGEPRAVAFASAPLSRSVAPCPVEECTGEARAHVRRPESLSPGFVQCSEDAAHRWEPHEWVGIWPERLIAMRPDLGTDEVAAMLGVSVDSVRKFVSSGRLPRGGSPRRAMFAFEDVERLRLELWAGAA